MNEPLSLTPCPDCGKVNVVVGNHCSECLKKHMDQMTPEDWSNALGSIFEDILKDDK